MTLLIYLMLLKLLNMVNLKMIVAGVVVWYLHVMWHAGK